MPRSCYFQGCAEPATTKEHVPPRSFFPLEKREQLLTVPSCVAHNGAKSRDDQYVLAHICLNVSPAHGSRKIFIDRVAPQLGFNEGALRAMLAKDSVQLVNGAVIYPVQTERFDRFFDALSCGIIYKSTRQSLPVAYRMSHIYHNFLAKDQRPEQAELERMISSFYERQLIDVLDFGKISTLNETVYTSKLFGLPNFASSITIVHRFFGSFRVTSMLSRNLDSGPYEDGSTLGQT